MRQSTKLNVITCPECGYEYLPGEIYLPKEFIGSPKDIVRDHNTHHITDYLGTTMNTRETYTCDCCGTTFKVEAAVKFFTKPCVEEDFSKDYTTNYRKVSLFLNED